MMDLCKILLPPGIEIRISYLQGRHADHYTTATYTTQQSVLITKCICENVPADLENR